MMRLRTSNSIYDDRDESDGTRILITRIYPRFIKEQHFDERMLVLSPDRDTLCKWKHSQKTEDDWKSIEEKFLPQMKDLAEWNQSQNYVEHHLLERRSHFSLSVRNESIVTDIL